MYGKTNWKEWHSKSANKDSLLPGWRLLLLFLTCVYVWLKMTWGCPLVVTSRSVSPAAPAGRPAVGAENRSGDWCPTAPGCNWRVSGWWLTCLFTLICCLHLSIQTTTQDSGWPLCHSYRGDSAGHCWQIKFHLIEFEPCYQAWKLLGLKRTASTMPSANTLFDIYTR